MFNEHIVTETEFEKLKKEAIERIEKLKFTTADNIPHFFLAIEVDEEYECPGCGEKHKAIDLLSSTTTDFEQKISIALHKRILSRMFGGLFGDDSIDLMNKNCKDN